MARFLYDAGENMKKITEGHFFSGRGMAGLVLLIIMIAALSAYGGSLWGATTVTVASTTSTVVTTVLSSTVSTFSFTQNIVQTQTYTTFQTITAIGPKMVAVSGSASTRSVGTIANQIDFVPVVNGSTVSDSVKNGQYSVTLPNYESYNVYIEYGTVTGNVGASKCVAAGLGLYILGSTLTADYAC